MGMFRTLDNPLNSHRGLERLACSSLSTSRVMVAHVFFPKSSYIALLLDDRGFLLHLLYVCMPPDLGAACVLLYNNIEI